MAKTKKPKILFEGMSDGAYVRVWKENREWAIQVWNSGKPEGEPDGDWRVIGYGNVPFLNVLCDGRRVKL